MSNKISREQNKNQLDIEEFRRSEETKITKLKLIIYHKVVNKF